MEFSQGVILVGVISLFLFLVAHALSKLAGEVKMLRGLVIAQIAEDAPRQLSSHDDPIVHDSHSEGDAYESVTKSAERAWG